MSQERDEVTALLQREVVNQSATDLEARAFNLISNWDLFEDAPEPEEKTSTSSKVAIMVVLMVSVFVFSLLSGNIMRAADNSSSARMKLVFMQTDIKEIQRQLNTIERKLP